MVNAPVREQATKTEKAQLTGIVVNHTHWDREWYMPFQRYRVLLVDAIDLLLDALSSREDYASFLLDGQTVVTEDYLEVRPEKRAELEGHIRSGRIVLGPWYVLPDEFIPSGESLIRNLLLGRRQMDQLGAPAARVGYLPDTFGHPAQLPQILAGFDMQSAVIYRGVQSNTSEFLWEAPDGTRLLTIYLPGGYFNAMELARAPHFWLAEKLMPSLDQLARYSTAGVVLLMNGCDHFQPQPVTQSALNEANHLQDRVALRQGTLAEYVDLVRQAEPDLSVKGGEWRYNRPSRITPGVLSARMYLKQADFRVSTVLERGAEPLQALAWSLGSTQDKGLLDAAWKYLLQNHPHDSICGCSIDSVHKDCDARFRWAEEIGNDLVERATARISRHIASTGDQPTSQPGFAVFNTLARPRSELVRQCIHFLEPGVAFSLVDDAGNPVPYQEVARRPMKIEWDPQRERFCCEGNAFLAVVVSPGEMRNTGGRWKRWFGEEVELLFPADMPAGGYTVVTVNQARNANPASTDQQISAGPDWLENKWLRVEVAPEGTFSLLDKKSDRRYGPLNAFRSEADRGDEYSFCPAPGDSPVWSRGGQTSIALVENGPLRATLEIETVMQVPERLTGDRTRRVEETVPLTIRSRISLGVDNRRVEIRTTVENRVQDHRLRVLFATGLRTEYADALGQFQVMSRAVELPEEERARVPDFDEEQEVSYHPQRAFVDVSDLQANAGLAVLNRGLPEYEAEPGDEGVWLGVTLLRCVGWLSRDDLSTRYKHAGPALETPDAQCPGQHTFEYAVVPHAGDWLAGGVAQEAEAYVTPVYSAPVTLPVGTPLNRQSFYSVGPGELMFSACKRSEDEQSLILRVYNVAPHEVLGTLDLGRPSIVRRANLAERELSEVLVPDPGTQTYRFPVRPNEIVTFSIRTAPGGGMKLSEPRATKTGADIVKQNLMDCAEMQYRVAEELAEPVAQAAAVLSDALLSGHKILVCGNGGSAADAQHFVGELVGRFKMPNRAALPAIALTVDSTLLTCIANDFSFEEVFSRQVEALAEPGDVVVGISTSGRSPNVLRALRAARERGAHTIALLGGDGGSAAAEADLAIVVPSAETTRVQECHITFIHAICEIIELEVTS